MKRIISLTLIFIIFALSSCGATPPEGGGTEPELTPYERALALESEARLAMQDARVKIETVYSAPSIYSVSTLVSDNGSFHFLRSDGVSEIDIVFISDTAYIRTIASAHEVKRQKTVTQGEALSTISKLVSNSIELTVSDFITAVCREDGDKTAVTCMLPSEQTKSDLLTQLYLDPASTVKLVEYSFTVSGGKYEKMSYFLTVEPEGSHSFSLSFTADFEYGEAYSVEPPADIDEYIKAD